MRSSAFFILTFGYLGYMQAIITRVDIFKTSIPLKQPFIISLGPIYSSENLVVQLHTDIGLTGTGECSPFVFIMGETQDSAFAMAQLIARILLGKNALELAERLVEIDSAIAFNYTVKGAFDMALYDLAARQAEQPLYQFLGGKVDKVIETDITVTLGEPEYMASEAVRYAEQGFPVLKVKLGDDGQKDVQRIAAMRATIGMELPLRVDANQGWQVDEAIRTLRALEPYNIQHCEAPVRRWDIFGLQKIKQQSPIPIMADESLFDQHDAARIIEMEACDLFNIKLAKSGGISNALKILDLADKVGIQTQVGSMGESRYGITALTHLAATRESIVYYDLDFPLLQAEDPVTGGMIYDEKWQVHLTDAPGIGASFQPDFLREKEWISIS